MDRDASFCLLCTWVLQSTSLRAAGEDRDKFPRKEVQAAYTYAKCNMQHATCSMHVRNSAGKMMMYMHVA